MRKYYQKTIWANSASGASLHIDSYKYRIVSSKVVGRKKYMKGYKYKYKIKYTERN